MIIAQNLRDFLSFIDIAKAKNVDYSIIGSEEETFEGAVFFGANPDNNTFIGRYVLLCSMFEVWVYVKTSIDKKQTITDISSTFNFTSFKYLSLKDGMISCRN